MLMDFTVLLALTTFFYSIGINWVVVFCGKNTYQTPISIALGLALTFSLFSWFVKFNYQPRYAIVFMFLIGASGWLFRSLRKIPFEIGLIPNPIVWFTTLLVGVISLFLNNQSKLLPQFSFRNGPDIFGWLVSSKYLCKVGGIDSLASNIQNSIGKQDLISAFSIPVPPGSLSVIQIPSFRDQIAGEFLIGANRTGLPGFQSYVCSILGEDIIIRVSNSLFALSFMLIAMILMITAAKSRPNLLKSIVFFVGLLSLNVVTLASAFEGGLASLLATPIILILIILVFQDENKGAVQVLAFTATLFAFSTYLDLLFQIGIFLSIFFVAGIIRGDINSVFLKNIKYFPLGAGLGSLLSLVNLSSVIRLTLDRLTSQSYGGWNQGRPPTYPEYLGVFNWLPSDGASPTPRNWISLVILFIITICILLIVKSLKRENQVIVLSTFIVYLVLMFIVYVLGSKNINNYILVKSGGIASLIFVVAIISNIDSIFTDNRKGTTQNRILGIKLLVISLPVLMLVSSVTYVSDWLVNSSDQKSLVYSENLTKIYNTYDLEVVGLYAAQLTLFGDLHFGAQSRGFQFRTLGSNPIRKHAFIFPAKSNCERKCEFFNKTQDMKNFTYVYRDDFMDIVEFNK